MSILRGIEQRVEGLFERGFRRAFRSGLQPVELARKLAREMEDHKTISVSRVYVPNEFRVYLSPQDRESFRSYEASLCAELATYLGAHARSAGLATVAPATVLLEEDSDLRLGEFGISCRMAESPEGHSAGVEAGAEAGAPLEPPEAPEPAQAPQAPQAPKEVPVAAVAAPAPAPPEPDHTYEPLAGVSGTQVISPEEARAQGLAHSAMTLVSESARLRVSKRVTTLGRSRECDLIVPDPNASRVHAEVRKIGSDHFLVDVGSTNGTEVNGHEVKRHVLADGDLIVIGTTEVQVELA